MGLLDLLLPARCCACGAGETLLCDGCLKSLRRLRPPFCARCGAPTVWPVELCVECAGRRLRFASARAAVAYEGPARRLVACFKEQGLRDLAGVLAAVVAEVVPRPPVEALAFVPGDRARSLWRGQNAAEALARALAPAWGLEVAPVLVRADRGARQRGLSRRERRVNVRGAFRARASTRQAYALVDDVYTTGATALAAASALRRAGAPSVHVVTFARAVRR